MTIESAQFKTSITGTLLNALDIGSGKYDFGYSTTHNFADGAGADQAGMVFTDTRTLSASATEDLDLAASLIDAFGATITFATIKGIHVYAASANTNDVQVQRASANGVPLFMAADDGVALGPDASMTVVDPNGFTVTAGTGDLLTLTNSSSGTSVTYTVVILGTV